jgi:hypothetical protein
MTSNSSNASSVALASRYTTVANSVASRFEYGIVRRRSVALDVIPRRASSTTRRAGTTPRSTSPNPIPATHTTRVNAATSALPVRSTGPRRNTSHAENRRPSGTSSKSSSNLACWAVSNQPVCATTARAPPALPG